MNSSIFFSSLWHFFPYQYNRIFVMYFLLRSSGINDALLMRCRYFYAYRILAQSQFSIAHKLVIAALVDWSTAHSRPSHEICLFYSFTVKHMACTILDKIKMKKKTNGTSGILAKGFKKTQHNVSILDGPFARFH